MDTSKLSKVIATVCLLEKLNTESVEEFERCLMKEIGFDNKNSFLCKILVLIRDKLSYESISKLRNKAIDLNTKQKENDSTVTTKNANAKLPKNNQNILAQR